MGVISDLSEIWRNCDHEFLIYKQQRIKFSDILLQNKVDLSGVKSGDVVAIIGDFNTLTIQIMLRVIDIGGIIVPLTSSTEKEHEYFFQSALVDIIIKDGVVNRRVHADSHNLINRLRNLNHGGLILFSTGTTGRPKAILHDLSKFLFRFKTPRPTYRTLNFLLFDHIGGINTLFHTLFNKGVVIAPEERTVESVLDSCRRYDIELLPTTPTFLRMMLISGNYLELIPECLKVITYGTERMDQPTLDGLCNELPKVDFRQTYGMSELGILRIKSKARNSLYMKIGGEGVETRVVNNTLQIRSSNRMLGYLNAASPFDTEGWYETNDIVEVYEGAYKIVGRVSEVINVGGLKFMASEVERVALMYSGVRHVKATSKPNPISGEHVELVVDGDESIVDKILYIKFLKEFLPSHMVPRRIYFGKISIGHRFKKN